jgi:hypothetical protein
MITASVRNIYGSGTGLFGLSPLSALFFFRYGTNLFLAVSPGQDDNPIATVCAAPGPPRVHQGLVARDQIHPAIKNNPRISRQAPPVTKDCVNLFASIYAALQILYVRKQTQLNSSAKLVFSISIKSLIF